MNKKNKRRKKMNQNQLKAKAPQAVASPPASPQAKPEQKPSVKIVEKPKRLLLPPAAPVLRFSPTAWAKLLFFRDRQETEVGGFGVAAANDLLRVEEFVAVKQDVTVASVSFDDGAVADFFEAQVDAGRKPDQFARIWLHTHPGNSPQPSCTDEETFARVFGACQWAVMFVLAVGGRSYARLRFNVGPGGQAVIPVEVDFRKPFGPSQQEAWEAEYKANVLSDWPFQAGNGPVDPWDRATYGGRRPQLPRNSHLPPGVLPDSGQAKAIAEAEGPELFGADADTWYPESGQEYTFGDITLKELAKMDPAEREYVMAELGIEMQDPGGGF
jgi:proteasome lid subunit RPN8/RPN11